jgi:hypothetical protein
MLLVASRRYPAMYSSTPISNLPSPNTTNHSVGVLQHSFTHPLLILPLPAHNLSTGRRRASHAAQTAYIKSTDDPAPQRAHEQSRATMQGPQRL